MFASSQHVVEVGGFALGFVDPFHLDARPRFDARAGRLQVAHVELLDEVHHGGAHAVESDVGDAIGCLGRFSNCADTMVAASITPSWPASTHSSHSANERSQ